MKSNETNPFSNMPTLVRLMAFHNVNEPSALAVKMYSVGLWTAILPIKRKTKRNPEHVY